MGFKLVCLDAAEPCKIKLSPGKHIIGRERFLFENENDNRVSRNHAEIVVADDDVTLTALHANPCFFQKRGEGVTDILFQNTSISLLSGDKFGILPDKYWYELIFSADMPDDESCANDKEEVTDKNAEVDEPETKEQENAAETSSFVPPPDSPTQQYDVEGLYLNLCEENAKAATKRPLTPDEPIDAKKVKNEPDDKIDQAGPSNKCETENKDDKANDANPGAAGQGNNPVVRERCMYGASCYRKNPAHKAQYSHPGDADWVDEGEAPECQWGAGCRRRDPRHRRDYYHPPRPQHRDQIGKKKKLTRDTRTSDNEDTPSADLIVNGKRARKPIRNYSWSGSESEGDRDPYATDESDEWQPSSDLTETQDY